MRFDNKLWERQGNRIHLRGTSITVLQWNSGKNANFMVEAGYRNSNHVCKTIHGKGPDARDAAISFAFELAKDKTYLEV
jgi:hypothetical protein